MAIGRLQAALASATNEVTVAAANLNFDFTLVKYEAPKEYQALGNVLSTKRKENAEFGSSHVLARQLGALFDGVCPSTPALLEAYGNRASEIANASNKNSQPFAGTLFGEYTGIDGTSVWAAATSSKCALHIHLLACMLARVWTAQEATAIWVELVSERKKEIARKVDQGEPVAFSLAAAVGQDISRPQLAALDNSARAWLRTADGIFRGKQTQLDLILKNLDVSMTGGPVVFPSVIETWKTALETMNKLVSGIPQAVQDGAALLGLSAWHLYPDMSIYSSELVEIEMKDSNIAQGGILSLGVSRRPGSCNQEGNIHWSLSLSQLRHYGRPVKVTRDLEADARLTWPQLSLVVFAALLEQWGSNGAHSEALARLLISLSQYPEPNRYLNERNIRMIKLLEDGASAYAKRAVGTRDLDHRLIQLGRRRSHEFFNDAEFARPTNLQPAVQAERLPFFGLLDTRSLLSAFKDTESAILYFRHAAARLSVENTPSDGFLIRQMVAQLREDGPCSESEISTSDCDDEDSMFLQEEETSDGADKTSDNEVESTEIGDDYRPHFSTPYMDYVIMTALAPKIQGGTDNAPHHRWLPAGFHDIPIPEDETNSQDALEKFKCWDDCLQISAADDPEEYVYFPVLGDSEQIALFSRRFPGNPSFFDLTPTIEDFQWCLDHNLLRPSILLQRLDHEQDDIKKTLRALTFAALIYNDLTNATVHPDVLTRPLVKSHWAQKCQSGAFEFHTGEHETILSMIAYLETGIYDIDPKLLKNAIAVSYEDSLFVSNSLIQDPYEFLPRQRVVPFQRILGNIGKPGLNFLLPPQEPITRETDTSSWKVDSYHQFDGTPSQSFHNTTMHLSFTDYHVPLFDGLRGAHDSQIFFLESVISVQDKGKWVADVDPWPLINSRILSYTKKELVQPRRLEDQDVCQHEMNSCSDQDITAVDTWDELLDVPAGIFVVRTGNNWVSRLASTLVTCQRMAATSSEFAVTICPPRVCWTCVQQNHRKHAFIF